MTRPIIIVGGGHNGLTAAAYLAKSGHRVLVLEAEAELGGLARRHTLHPGYQIPGVLPDTGQVWPRVVEDLGLHRFGLSWCEPAPIWVPDTSGEASGRAKREGIWLHGDQARGAISARDADEYAAYRRQLARMAAAVRQLLHQSPPDPHGKLWPLIKTGWQVKKLGAEDMTELLRIGPMPVADWLAERFDDAHLRAALCLPALDGAYMAPRSPGSAGNLLLHECARGARLVGGPSALIHALERAATSFGAEIRKNVRVARIVLDPMGTRVKAVDLATRNGVDTIEAERVAVSCDPKRAFLELIGARYLPAHLGMAMRNIRTRGIVAQLDLALAGPLENHAGELLEHARIAGTPDQVERAFDSVKYGEFSARPALEIRVHSAADPALCSHPGHHVASVRAYFAPHELRAGWVDGARVALREAILERASAHLPGLRERIVASELVTPADMAARYGVSGGHIFHGEHALDQLLFMRPTIECSQYHTPIRGLFLCGSGSHPGGGLSCAPGALAAAAIERESYSRAPESV